MPREASGSAIESRGKWYARTPIGEGKRHLSPMPWCAREKERDRRRKADERAAIVAEIARGLRATETNVDAIKKILDDAAATERDDELDAARDLVERVTKGAFQSPTGSTFADVANDWTSGKLARQFPDHVKTKKSADTDVHRLTHILPIVGPIPVVAFTLKDAERVMASLPSSLSTASRRHVAQLMTKILALAVYPLRLREASPFPRGFLPKLGPRVALSWVYPDEEAKVLSTTAIPIAWRLFEGFLAREGLRRSEAAKLKWTDVDTKHGTIRLDASKTDIPRAWALGPDVVRALVWWRSQRPKAECVFSGDDGKALTWDHAADEYRRHLELAGVTRAELFERSAKRRPIRVHDLRASFVSLALATGRTETWVRDRTGHQSSVMLERYRRVARSAEELGFTWFAPLDVAIPEIAGSGSKALLSGSATREGQQLGKRHVKKSREIMRRGRRRVGLSGFRFQWGNSLAGSSPVLRTKGFSNREPPQVDRADPEPDPERPFRDLVALAVEKRDLETAKRALDLIEASRRERAGNVVSLDVKRRAK
jgi:integrase